PPPPSTLFPYTTLFRSTIVWNVDPNDVNNYDADFADKKHGDIIAYLLSTYRQALQLQGAAPTDGSACFVASELARLDAIVAGTRSEEHTSELQSQSNLV